MHRRSRSGYENVSQREEDVYFRDEKQMNRRGEPKDNVSISTSRSISRIFTIGGLFALVLLITGITGSNGSHSIPPETKHIEPGAQFLHVLVMANQKDHNVCKSLVSAASLNYPIPEILNWKANFNDSSRAEGGAQMARVESVLSFIDYTYKIRGKEDRQTDVVIIVDGFDTWFQLRPDVMLERFFEINRQANNRVVKSMGQAAMDASHIRQKIVFGAQKTCTRSKDDPACYAVPKSTLPDGKQSAKYLDAGFVMGELGAIHELYDKAKWHMDFVKDKVTTQDMFSRLFGEQEYQREITKQRYSEPGFFSLLLEAFGLKNNKGLLGAHATHRRIPAVPAGEAEFGIGLDYESLLTSSTTGKPDSNWLVRSNSTEIARITKEAKLHSRTYPLPTDIQRSLEPFWSRNPNDTLPQTKGWQDTPLFTNLHTGVIPASIQHLSPRADINPQNIRQAGWKKMWFRPYARTLLDEHVNEPYRSVAVLRDAYSETAWWPLHQQKWRLRDHSNRASREWMAWKDVCDGFYDEIFADGKGTWRVPRLEY